MNDYFNYTPLTPNTVARASDVNTRFSGVETGFELLPPPVYLYEDRITYSVDTGSAANIYVATPAIPITAYSEGLRIRLKAAHTNTGVSTLNVSGLGVKPILRSDATALSVSDIVAGQILDLTYDGAAFRLGLAFAELSPAGVMAKIAAGGNMIVNGSVTSTAFIVNGQTLDGLTATGVSIAEAANVGAVTTLLGLGTAAFQASTAFATPADIANKLTVADDPAWGVGGPKRSTVPFGCGDLATEGAVHLQKGTAAKTGFIEFDLPSFAGGATIGANLSANGRILFARYGTIPAFEFDTAPFVGTNAILTTATGAALASPAFTGTPTAPTAATANNTTQLATTAYVQANLTSYATLASPTLTGTPATPTAAPGTNTTQIASTAFVTAAVAAGGGGGGAPLNSPAFTGVPTAPTAAVDTNTTQLATTAYVIGQGYAKSASPTFTGTVAVPTPATADNTTKAASTAFVQANLATYAPLASPALTGTPTAPTQAGGNNTTRIATTAFVQGELGGFADAFLTVVNFTAARTLSDAGDNNNLLRFTGTITRTITMNSTPTAGFSTILANRGTVSLTLSAASGVYVNGAGATATTATLATGGKVTLIHEGGGVWTADGTGVS